MSSIEKWWKTKILGRKDDETSSQQSQQSRSTMSTSNMTQSTNNSSSHQSYINPNTQYAYVNPQPVYQVQPLPPSGSPDYLYNQPGMQSQYFVQPVQQPQPQPKPVVRSQQQNYSQNLKQPNYKQNPYDAQYDQVIKKVLQESIKTNKQEEDNRKKIQSYQISNDLFGNNQSKNSSVRQLDRSYDNITMDNNKMKQNNNNIIRGYRVDNNGNIVVTESKKKVDQREMQKEIMQEFDQYVLEGLDVQPENNSNRSGRNGNTYFEAYKHKTNSKSQSVYGVRIRYDDNGTRTDFIMCKLFNYIIHYLKFDIKSIESYDIKPKSKRYDDCIEFYFYKSSDQKQFIALFNKKPVHICGKSVKAEACRIFRRRLDDDLIAFIKNNRDSNVKYGYLTN